MAAREPAAKEPAAKEPTAVRPVYSSTHLKNVPHVRQKSDFCGEACAAMYLQKLGYTCDQDYVFDCSGLDPALARGCHTKELAQALKTIGFQIGPVWHLVKSDGAAREIEAQFAALHGDLVGGVPSIVCMRTSNDAKATEHFRFMLGYDARTDEIVYHEPAEDNGSDRRMGRKEFLALWPLINDEKTSTLVRLRLEPGKLRAQPEAKAFSSADYCQHLIALKPRIPEGFHVVVEPPFVVLGDDAAEVVQKRAENTVRWAVKLLKQDFFERDPNYIISVWLFKDKASYERNTLAIFNDKPTTPYGYFSHTHRALIMNISTGGGTLVHEIVHPFMAANFPKCPSWFNEGLASLYEQCGEENGHIQGYPNWRLNGLQNTIQQSRLGMFKELCGTSTQEFYNDQRGTNYAQARYLCYYLQERGLLRKYYQHFNKNVTQDPTGYATLANVLEVEDMKEFQTKWEKWVAELKR